MSVLFWFLVFFVTCLQNQQRYKFLMVAYEKHNKLLAEAMEGNGKFFKFLLVLSSEI